MKRLSVFLIVFSLGFFGYSQFHQFQLVLVDSNIGSEVFAGCQGCGSESNDEGLNTIFQNHNVNYYQATLIYSSEIEDLYDTIYIGSCDGCDTSQLAQDLNDYNSVVLIASSNTNENNYFFNHGLGLRLVDNSIGIPNGETNGIVSTNNADLNQIFTDFNVSHYQLVNEGSSNFERFELFCNCDAALLKQELDALSTVVFSTEQMAIGVLLSTEEEILTKVKIHPNPFTDKVSIDVNVPIESIILYDILGKQVYKASSITNFENFSSSLKSGIYILKLKSDNGQTVTKKLIKS